MQIIQRPAYLAFLKRHRDRQLIKVVSGVRRAGKSTLFQLYQAFLRESGVAPDHILSVNFEDLAFEELTEYHALYRFLTEKMTDAGKYYIFLDEIQQVPHFERAVDSLFLKENADVYLTGSNAYFLSGELATLLAGRYVEMHMLPLSFAEFCAGLGSAPLTLAEKYERYTRGSSFPYALQFGEDDAAREEYLQGLLSTILVKDTLTRLGTSDLSLLTRLLKYLSANVGSPISINKIANALTSAGRKTSNKTVERYLGGLKDSLLLYEAGRYDVRGKELLKTNAKYYLVDPALRRLLISNALRDTGHVLENVIYLELLRRGNRVSVGQLDTGEIDFVTEKDGARAYYQIAQSTLAPEVLERELAPLLSVRDQYPKYLLTLDEIESEADYEGIRKQNALRWLLS